MIFKPRVDVMFHGQRFTPNGERNYPGTLDFRELIDPKNPPYHNRQRRNLEMWELVDVGNMIPFDDEARSAYGVAYDKHVARLRAGGNDRYIPDLRTRAGVEATEVGDKKHFEELDRLEKAQAFDDMYKVGKPHAVEATEDEVKSARERVENAQEAKPEPKAAAPAPKKQQKRKARARKSRRPK